MASFTTTKIPPLNGRTIVITGANGGVSRATATGLAKRDGRKAPQPKPADHLFAQKLQRRLTAIGSPVISVVAHPGFTTTNLMDAGGRGLRHPMKKFLTQSVAQSADSGALPSLYATTAGIPGDSYIDPRRLMGMRDTPVPARRAAKTYRADVARRLREEPEKPTGTTFPLSNGRTDEAVRR